MEPLPPTVKTGAEAEAYAHRLERRRRRRTRRRLGALAVLLILGLALGTIYATGFATTGGATGDELPANPAFVNPTNNQDTSELNGKITSSGNLTWSWQGQWGSVASQSMYSVDLDEFAASEKFFAEVLLTTIPAGFSDIQLQLRIKNDGTGGTCTAADIEGVGNTNDYRIFIFDAADAQVTFSGMNGVTTGLDGGSTYCIGVANYSGSGMDSAGTFIRKSNKGPQFNGQFPTFVATLNRMT